LRKAVAAQAARDEKAVQAKRMKPPSLAGDHEDQSDLITDGEPEL
jgi:hypothetical protein